MKRTRLGQHGPEVFPLALGCMGMSGVYGHSTDEEGIATIQEAIERGINVIDTGDFYGMGHNELLVGRALAGRRGKALLSVKFGALRGPDGAFNGIDTRPAALKNFASYSLKRLGVDVIDIYRPARLDPAVPIEETVGAIAELIDKGYVRYIGLSEVGAETIRRAHATHPVADLQIEYSLASRSPEQKIFPALEELGVSATLYGVLSRGLLSGRKPTEKETFERSCHGLPGKRAGRTRRRWRGSALWRRRVAARRPSSVSDGCSRSSRAWCRSLGHGTASSWPICSARWSDPSPRTK